MALSRKSDHQIMNLMMIEDWRCLSYCEFSHKIIGKLSKELFWSGGELLKNWTLKGG